MIKNNECKVEITTRNKKYYNDKRYNCDVGDTITIDISTMPKMSKNIITAICEICELEFQLSYSKYNKNVERGGFYSCKKCSDVKRKKSNLEKYGVEYVAQRSDIRENNKIWMSSDEFKEKSKIKQIQKYGCLYTQTDEFKENISIIQKKTIHNKKQNNEYICNLSKSENRELRERGMFEKYGHTYSFHIDSIKNKIQNINLEKYGHISPLGNKEIQDKIKNTFIEKYGVDNPFKNFDIQYKIIKERELKINNLNTKLYKEYRKLIRFYTDKNKSKLFENWNGLDYYDGEYIKDFLSFKSNNLKYPTIDHKISCIYGFKNNIDPIEISKIENLCITKRIINSKKSHLNEYDFLKIINSI